MMPMKRGVILIVCVVALLAIGLGGAASDMLGFTGLWSADLTLSTIQTTPISAFHSRLDAAAFLGPVSLGARSDFDVDGWLWQSFQATASVAFFSVEANLLYAPDPWTFAYAGGFVSLNFGGAWLTYYAGFLGSIFEGSVWRGSVIEIGGSIGATSLSAYLYLGATLDGVLFTQSASYVACTRGDCVAPAYNERYYTVLPIQSGSLSFTGAEIQIDSYLCHDVTLTSTTMFSPAGFLYQEFHTKVWAIGMLPINIDLVLRFSLQTKSLTLTPTLGLGTRFCYGRVLVDLIAPGPIGLIEGFSIYGLDLFLETPTFAIRSLSVFDTVNYSLFRTDGFSLSDSIWIGEKTGTGTCGSAGEMLPDYWEVLGIGAYRGDACCRTLSFLALTYFGDSGSTFDWMRSEFRAQLTIMDGLGLRTHLTLDSDGVSDWTLGISIAW